MARKQQTFKGLEKPNPCFGGSLLKGSNAKNKRPLDSKLPIHLVLKATKSTLRNPKVFADVQCIVEVTARKYGVKIYEFANVKNHLHLVIRIAKISRWAPYIRELTGRIARLVQDRLSAKGKFWLHRPFTRIIQSWRKAFQTAKEYVQLNWLEGEGLVDRSQTKALKDLRRIWADG